MTYEEFLKQKSIVVESSGFDCDDRNSLLFDWQNDIVRWALKKGRAAIFSDCGLGKTACQLWWAAKVAEHTGKPVLILAPLAVAKQTAREGEKFNIPVMVCRKQADVKPGVNVTNYEILEHFTPSAFAGVVLDESSILKAYMGKTKREIIRSFEDTPYRLACTATPSPNDLMELLNQSEYLGIMKSNEALAIWFIADQSQMGTYRLKKFAVNSFWDWVATWAVCFQKPSDLSPVYSDEGYILPPLEEHDVVLEVDELDYSLENGFIRDIQTSATGFHREKKITLKQRCEKCRQIAEENDEQALIWCFTNDEADELKRIMPDAVEVRGSDSREKKETAAMDFADGKTRVLISKSSIFGYGLNFQNCHKAIFCGLDYSYESYYQAVRRLYRFGQGETVHIWRVLGSTEQNILKVISTKSSLQAELHGGMVEAMRRRNEVGKQQHYKAYMRTDAKVTVPAWIRSETI